RSPASARSRARRSAATARRRRCRRHAVRPARPARWWAAASPAEAALAMVSTVLSLGLWNWFIAGGILLALEVMAPGTFMLWLGLSALLAGVISLAVDWPWQAQFVAFAVFAIASIPIWHRVGRRVEAPIDQPFLNRRSAAFVGQSFTLDK